MKQQIKCRKAAVNRHALVAAKRQLLKAEKKPKKQKNPEIQCIN